MTQATYTKQFIANLLMENTARGHRAIGRALVALLVRQTETEKTCKQTILKNFRGFSQPDAKYGSACAEHFLANGTLTDEMIAYWRAPMWRGRRPRITKYAGQLAIVANEKAAG